MVRLKDQNHVLLLAPLVIQGFSAVVLLIASVLAWGAANPFSDVNWIPTIAGLVIGGAMVLGTYVSLRHLIAVLAEPVRVDPRIIYGLVMIAVLSLSALLIAWKIGDTELYRARWERAQVWNDGDIVVSLEPRGFTLAAIIAVFPGPFSWLLIGSHVLYAEAIEPRGRDKVRGIDPMGEILNDIPHSAHKEAWAEGAWRRSSRGHPRAQ